MWCAPCFHAEESLKTMIINKLPVAISVLANFRGTVQHGLPLEIGDTVQILEKCEGN